MTIAIKSNIAIKLKKLTDYNISGLTASLDFRDGTYKKNGANIALSDLIAVTRSTTGGQYDAYANYSEVGANMPRISTDLTSVKKGLFVESGFTNQFKNSFAPANQSIATSQSIGAPLILDVVGTGSITVSKSGVALGTATQDNPVVIFPDTTGSVTYDFIVSGSLTYAAFYISTSAIKRVTRAKTTTANITVNSDIAQIIGSSKLIDLFGSDKTGCVVIKQFTPKNVFERTKSNAQTTPILQLIDATTSTSGVFVNRQLNSTLGNFLRIQDGAKEQIYSASLELKQRNIYAINVSPTTAKMAVNGALSGKLTFNTLDYATINIASGTSYSANDTQYVEEILFFDRELTDDELKLITKM